MYIDITIEFSLAGYNELIINKFVSKRYKNWQPKVN